MDAALREIPEEDECAPTCGLCHGSLRMPRLLPCLDIFCLVCLERHVREGHGSEAASQSKCPTCGKPFSIPAGGLQEMKLADHALAGEGDSVCQLCGDDRQQVETYCVNCALAMCWGCHKVHSRVQGASHHILLSLLHGAATDVTSGAGPSGRERVMDCTQHEHQPLRYCCVTCDKLLCGSCKTEDHEGHKVEPLDRGARCKRETPEGIVISLQRHQTSTTTVLQEASRYLVSLRQEFARAEKHVETRAQQLALRQLCTRRQREEKDVAEHVNSLKRAEHQVSNAAHYSKCILPCASDAEIVQVSLAILERQRMVRRHQNFLLKRHLKVTVRKETAMADDCLQLSEVDFGVNVVEAYPELLAATTLSTIQTDSSITGLATTADDLLVVVSFCGQKLAIYNRAGKRTCEIRHDMTQPVSAVVTPSQRIYVTDLGIGKTGMCIRSFTTDGQALPDSMTLPSKPWGVAVTKTGDFVVCHPEIRKVGIYHPDGTLKLSLKSESGQHFTNPRCVAVNIDGNIIVSDFAKHNIRIFDPEGKFFRSYGSEGKGPEQLRRPCGVCCDRYGHILIADSDNNRVHVLSAQGELRGYLFGGEGGVEEPVAVEITSGGELLVGEWKGKVHVIRYV